ncbi:MAG: carbon-nitrogen hydrolase family protein, partial [Chloroflexota bacterium]
MEKIRIAGVQMTPRILEKARNLNTCLERLKEATRLGARLTVFPECCLTGYCFPSLDEAIPLAETIPGPSTQEIAAACQKLQVHVIIGLIE